MFEDILRRFNGDLHTKEALLEFLFGFIDKEVLKRVYEKRDTSGLADARELIMGAFEELESAYGIPEQKKIQQKDTK